MAKAFITVIAMVEPQEGVLRPPMDAPLDKVVVAWTGDEWCAAYRESVLMWARLDEDKRLLMRPLKVKGWVHVSEFILRREGYVITRDKALVKYNPHFAREIVRRLVQHVEYEAAQGDGISEKMWDDFNTAKRWLGMPHDADAGVRGAASIDEMTSIEEVTNG